MLKKIKLLLSWLYTLNHWEGCEKLSLWEYIYKRRIGIKTAYKISSGIINGF